jgi:hypothetical protein
MVNTNIKPAAGPSSHPNPPDRRLKNAAPVLRQPWLLALPDAPHCAVSQLPCTAVVRPVKYLVRGPERFSIGQVAKVSRGMRKAQHQLSVAAASGFPYHSFHSSVFFSKW